VTKVYIPRIFIPVAPVLSGMVDFTIGLGVLAGLLAWYGIVPPVQVFLLPFFILFAVVTAIAVTLWLSALNVRYRDVQYTIPFLSQAWFFATPVAYSALVFPAHLRMYIGINPMAGVVQGFRWAIIGSQAGQVGHLMLLSFGVVLLLLVGGLEYYRRVERSFADVV
jgi:lipopolysaccharide transport system permease protein